MLMSHLAFKGTDAHLSPISLLVMVLSFLLKHQSFPLPPIPLYFCHNFFQIATLPATSWPPVFNRSTLRICGVLAVDPMPFCHIVGHWTGKESSNKISF